MSEPHGNASDPHGQEPRLSEPKTPMWLPALGAVLFLTVGLIWGLMPADKPIDSTSPSGSASAAAGDAGGAPGH